jgi:hypothetical protein
MFLVIYEDHGKEPENLATASNIAQAKSFISMELGLDDPAEIDSYEWKNDDEGRMLCILGDAQYVIQPLKHVD